MIIGPDWIWLHFPKCGGTSAEKLLRLNFSKDESVTFDYLDATNMVWHDNIAARKARDPGVDLQGKRIVAILRRLPDWLLSRVHFEAARPPHYTATREMILKGAFYENTGYVNSCERTLQHFNNPKVDFWVRLEKMHEDFEAFFGRKLMPLEHRLNENSIKYVRSQMFWFTQDELEQLYKRNPGWSAEEQRVYGNLPVQID
jgi:hypothetical protein